MMIDIKIFVALLVFTLGIIVSWCTYVTVTLGKIQHSVKFTNTNLRLIDWEKVPKKNLNDII